MTEWKPVLKNRGRNLIVCRSKSWLLSKADWHQRPLCNHMRLCHVGFIKIAVRLTFISIGANMVTEQKESHFLSPHAGGGAGPESVSKGWCVRLLKQNWKLVMSSTLVHFRKLTQHTHAWFPAILNQPVRRRRCLKVSESELQLWSCEHSWGTCGVRTWGLEAALLLRYNTRRYFIKSSHTTYGWLKQSTLQHYNDHLLKLLKGGAGWPFALWLVVL